MKQRFFIVLAIMLALFTAIGGAGAQDAQTELVPWIEPGSSFGAMVPADWQVQGGALDLFGMGILPQIVAVSPDQSQVIVVGADRVYAFVEPNVAVGIAEGDTLPIGLTALSLYQPADFLHEYLQMWLVDGGTCSSITVTPDANAEQSQPSYLAGEVDLTCAYSAGQASGRFYAGIYIVDDPNLGRVWIVGDLFGYLADAGQEASAESVLSTVVQTLSYAPQGGGAGDAGTGYGDPYADGVGTDADAMLAQQMNAQINQMTSSHFTNTMVDQMNWFQQNQEMIMGIRTEYDAQYEYQWMWEIP
jgi:hypothetical protein